MDPEKFTRVLALFTDRSSKVKPLCIMADEFTLDAHNPISPLPSTATELG